MKLSVIIPCYNFEKYIEQSILSALSQKTNFEFEVIVRDDGSTDSSLTHIKKFDSSIRILDSSENLGGKKNIKTLIENCKGEYIAYLDGDDYWTNRDKLQKQVDFLDSNPECIMTCTGYYERRENNYKPSENKYWMSMCRSYSNWEVRTENLLINNPATYGRTFRNLNNLIKDWMFDIRFLDWAINYELSKYGYIKYLDFPGGVYRIHEGGVFSMMDEKKVSEIKSDIRNKLKIQYDCWKSI